MHLSSFFGGSFPFLKSGSAKTKTRERERKKETSSKKERKEGERAKTHFVIDECNYMIHFPSFLSVLLFL